MSKQLNSQTNGQIILSTKERQAVHAFTNKAEIKINSSVYIYIYKCMYIYRQSCTIFTFGKEINALKKRVIVHRKHSEGSVRSDVTAGGHLR